MERHKVQEWTVESGWSGSNSRWTGNPIPEEKEENRVKKSSEDRSKGGI